MGIQRLRRKKTEAPEQKALLSNPAAATRMVLLGKSGVGKSAAGNTILGERVFKSVLRMNSVTDRCSEAHSTVSGRSVSVVDTPGFFDTKMNPEELAEEMARSVYLSSPGSHAFLIVLRVDDRFTEQEQKIPQMIEMMFGEEVLKYSMILFTHGDALEGESVEKLIQKNTALRALVQHCGGGFHVFNNKALEDREQVQKLLKKIDSMVEKNGGGHYSNEMFEEAQRFRQEEEEKRQREEAENKLKEELKRKEEIEGVKRETEERVRREEEERRQRERAEMTEQERESVERGKKETKTVSKTEHEESKGFMSFLAKYKKRILIAVAIGVALGAIIMLGVSLGPLSFLALNTAGVTLAGAANCGVVFGGVTMAITKLVE